VHAATSTGSPSPVGKQKRGAPLLADRGAGGQTVPPLGPKKKKTRRSGAVPVGPLAAVAAAAVCRRKKTGERRAGDGLFSSGRGSGPRRS